MAEAEKEETEVELGLFDGEILRRRLERFVHRLNHALPVEGFDDYAIEQIFVNLTVDANLNVGFAGVGGGLSRSTTFTFVLKPRKVSL